MKTSPGYPFSLKFRSKDEALQDSRVYTYCVSKVERAEPPNCYWTLFGKAEPKKQEKIDSNSARVVVGAPLDLQCEAAYLFAIQNSHIYEAGKTVSNPFYSRDDKVLPRLG